MDALFQKWVSQFHFVVVAFLFSFSCWLCPHCAWAQKNGMSYFTTWCFAWTVSLFSWALYFPSCHCCFLWSPLWHRALSSSLRGVPTESSIPCVWFWQPSMGVETNTHAFDADPIGYWTKILLGDRMYAFVRQNKCVTFEERRGRAWLLYVCSVKCCTTLFYMHPFVKQCLIEETCAKPFYFG